MTHRVRKRSRAPLCTQPNCRSHSGCWRRLLPWQGLKATSRSSLLLLPAERGTSISGPRHPALKVVGCDVASFVVFPPKFSCFHLFSRHVLKIGFQKDQRCAPGLPQAEPQAGFRRRKYLAQLADFPAKCVIVELPLKKGTLAGTPLARPAKGECLSSWADSPPSPQEPETHIPERGGSLSPALRPLVGQMWPSGPAQSVLLNTPTPSPTPHLIWELGSGG